MPVNRIFRNTSFSFKLFFFFSNEAAHPIFVGAARSELLFLGHEQPWGKPSLRAGGLGRLRKEEDTSMSLSYHAAVRFRTPRL